MTTRKALAFAMVLGAPLCQVVLTVAVPKLFGVLLITMAPFFGTLSLLGIIFVFLFFDAIARVQLAASRDIIPY